MKFASSTLAIALLCSAASTPFAFAEKAAPAAEKTNSNHKAFNAAKDSVYQVKATVKVTVNSDDGKVNQSQEDKIEGLATCIDPSGTLVSSLSLIDKASAIDGKEVNTPMGKIKLSAKSEISDIKIVMPDGTEIPAEITLKDPDQDLAFIQIKADAPEAKDKKLSAIDLSNSVVPEILDDVLLVSRLDKTYNNESSALKCHIMGKTTKPRLRMRIPISAMPEFIGVPVVSTEGPVVGLMVMGKGNAELTQGDNTPSPTVIPASDILKVAKQLKDKK